MEKKQVKNKVETKQQLQCHELIRKTETKAPLKNLHQDHLKSVLQNATQEPIIKQVTIRT